MRAANTALNSLDMAGPLTTVPDAKDTIFLDKGRRKLVGSAADCPVSMRDPMQEREHEDCTLEVTWRGSSGPWVVETGLEDGSWAQRSLAAGAELVLGSSKRAALVVEDRAVSGLHCRLGTTERGVIVEDLGSKNGVFVGGARVTKATLGGQHSVFVIGRTTVVVRRAGNRETDEVAAEIPGLVGASAAMRQVAREIRRYARLSKPVLIQGESGTGKDVVAHALHRESGRAGMYVPLNVGGLVESLADAELFGHRRGAFTGAVTSRVGAFEQADKGTLFLDEIAELSHSLQVKLLRVVEDGFVRPLGGEAVRVNVRLISATWARLDVRVMDARFREDLFHRLSTMVIDLPPLRERRTDIPALAAALLARHERDLGPKRLSTRALARLVECPWPGNVRQLDNVLYRAAVASQGTVIEVEHVDPPRPDGRRRASVLSPSDALSLLERNRGNVAVSARCAGVPRSTFRAWIAKAKP
jgi:transcriptional regulator of acetoin/glycerol metabolism